MSNLDMSLNFNSRETTHLSATRGAELQRDLGIEPWPFGWPYEKMDKGDFSETVHKNKKRRLMAPPDGFLQPQDTKLTAPSFTSAFTTAKSSKTALFKSVRPPQFKLTHDDLGHPSNQKFTPRNRIHPVTPSKPGQSSKRNTAITSFQPLVHSNNETTPPKVFPILQRAPSPPTISNKVQVATTPLKSMPPPPVRISTGNARDLKSIFNTRLALAADPMTESGHAELMSIFLQDQHNLTCSSEAELVRGVLTSPEKGSRTRGSKYIRNGLADHARRVLSRSHTSFVLWQRDIENLLSARRTTSDRHFLVTKVVYFSKSPPERASMSGCMRFAVVLCRDMNEHDEENNVKHKKQHVLLLSSIFAASNLRVSNLDGLGAGCELHVWRPYHEIDLPALDEVSIGRTTPALLCSRFLVVKSAVT